MPTFFIVRLTVLSIAGQLGLTWMIVDIANVTGVLTAADSAEVNAPGIAIAPLYISATIGLVAAAVALATPLKVT